MSDLPVAGLAFAKAGAMTIFLSCRREPAPARSARIAGAVFPLAFLARARQATAPAAARTARLAGLPFLAAALLFLAAALIAMFKG